MGRVTGTGMERTSWRWFSGTAVGCVWEWGTFVCSQWEGHNMKGIQGGLGGGSSGKTHEWGTSDGRCGWSAHYTVGLNGWYVGWVCGSGRCQWVVSCAFCVVCGVGVWNHG